MFRTQFTFLNTSGGLKFVGSIWCDESGLVRLESAKAKEHRVRNAVGRTRESLISAIGWLDNLVSTTEISKGLFSGLNHDLLATATEGFQVEYKRKEPH